jgi:hypothetical protein
MALDSHPSFFLSNLLHPSYYGKKLSDEERYAANEYLEVYCSLLGIWDNNKNCIAESLQQFLGRSGLIYLCVALDHSNSRIFFQGYFKSSILWFTECKDPISWWKALKSFENHSHLASIAIRLLSIPPSNTSCERSFSRQGLIHTKLRNRLSHDKVKKLVSVQHNLHLMSCKNPVKDVLNEASTSREELDNFECIYLSDSEESNYEMALDFNESDSD